MNKDTLIRTVEKAKGGDRTAFESLYNEYYDKIYCFVLKNMKNKTNAEDITQEAFVRSMQKISYLNDPASYESWLHTIAYNICRDFFRDEKHYACFDTDEERENAMAELALNAPMMLPADHAENEERKRQLQKMLDELKPEMRAAMILYYYDELSLSKVAKKLGIKENSAKQRIFQARKKLRKKIDSLAESGVVLSAVPLGKMLRSTVDKKYAAAAGAACSPAVVSTKVVGACAAAVIAVGVPVGLGLYHERSFGDSRVMDNSVSITKRDNSSAENSEAEKHAEISESSYSDVHRDDLSHEESSHEGESSRVENDLTDTNTNDSEADIGAPKKRDGIDVNTLLSMTVNDALGLGANGYEMVYPTGVQAGGQDVYKCSDFPEYCFGSRNTPTDRINVLNLYSGAYINNEIYVGMTYNEIEQALGEDIYISATFDDLDCAAFVTIDGRRWEIAFDLTEEQKNEILNALDATPIDSPRKTIDISYLNPVSTVAVYDVNRTYVSVETLLSMTVYEALLLGNSDYETAAPKGETQEVGSLYRCYAFDKYCFGSAGGGDGAIDYLELYEDALINGYIMVGIRYTDFGDWLGEGIEIQRTDDGLEYAAFVAIDSRVWEIGFELTEEEKEEIDRRIQLTNGTGVDISDIDPVSYVAIYHG